jgi:hypothetical protein
MITVTRKELQKLVDIIWNTATDSTEVPSTKWADSLVDQWYNELLQKRKSE